MDAAILCLGVQRKTFSSGQNSLSLFLGVLLDDRQRVRIAGPVQQSSPVQSSAFQVQSNTRICKAPINSSLHYHLCTCEANVLPPAKLERPAGAFNVDVDVKTLDVVFCNGVVLKEAISEKKMESRTPFCGDSSRCSCSAAFRVEGKS